MRRVSQRLSALMFCSVLASGAVAAACSQTPPPSTPTVPAQAVIAGGLSIAAATSGQATVTQSASVTSAATAVYTCTGLTNDQASYVGVPGNSAQSSAQVLSLLASTIPNFPANPALSIGISTTVPATAAAGTPYSTVFDFSAGLPASLVSGGTGFVVPVNGGRVALAKASGQHIFTGYLTAAPAFQYLGWGETGPVYRYNLVAKSDETVLDRKRLPYRSPFVARSAGSALAQLTQDLQPGVFDTSGVQSVDVLASYIPDPQKTWAQHAAEIALQVRGSYRTLNGTLVLAPVGAATYTLNKIDAGFSPEGLMTQPVDGLINDVTVIG